MNRATRRSLVKAKAGCAVCGRRVAKASEMATVEHGKLTAHKTCADERERAVTRARAEALGLQVIDSSLLLRTP